AGKTFLFIERDVGLEGNDVAGMIDFMTCLDREISPRNHYLVQAYAICTPEEARKKKVLDKLMEIIESNLEKLMPGFKTYTNWILYLPVWHLDGVAKTIENKKPPLITPIENLYLVGDCTKAPGVGVNCAMSSAKLLHEIIKKK
ncbi:MAG: NAD(P)/FAD-dependent oxidoreductase, partial [Thermoplasmata archaeon]